MRDCPSHEMPFAFPELIFVPITRKCIVLGWNQSSVCQQRGAVGRLYIYLLPDFQKPNSLFFSLRSLLFLPWWYFRKPQLGWYNSILLCYSSIQTTIPECFKLSTKAIEWFILKTLKSTLPLLRPDLGDVTDNCSLRQMSMIRPSKSAKGFRPCSTSSLDTLWASGILWPMVGALAPGTMHQER